MRMNCNIIKDLLPSYIDDICSEDTRKVVEEHLAQCEKCRLSLKRMQQQTDYIQQMPEEAKKAISPFKKINKKRRIQVFVAIVFTFIITIISMLIVQEVSAVNQIFFPKKSAIVVVDSMEVWEKIHFNDNDTGTKTKDYLIYNSIFWNKKIVNTAGSPSDITLRVKDEDGNIVVDELRVRPGTSVKVDSLKNNKKYYFEIKAQEGRFFINAV
ncbi:hypothetical protein ADM90_00870 [Lysinibacillus macroides]|uniref:Anti-sigma-W factor RsiW n=2 Tax=Lysinibacillus macroides TaxID=33935 RepID=A0A0M9DNF7_9BACI|nr:hypothetical protein ADM90_00870 [Lysinibacillus macroides]